jgi:hypothetical protein
MSDQAIKSARLATELIPPVPPKRLIDALRAAAVEIGQRIGL